MSAEKVDDLSGSGCLEAAIAQKMGKDLDRKLPPAAGLAETGRDHDRSNELPLGGVLPKTDTRQPSKLTPVEKKRKRKEANRKAAKECRDRRRDLISELSVQAHTINKSNDELAASNRAMRTEVQDLKRQLAATLDVNAARRERERTGMLFERAAMLFSQQPDLGLPNTLPFSGQHSTTPLQPPPQHTDERLEPPKGGGSGRRDRRGLPPSLLGWDKHQWDQFNDKRATE